MAQITFEKLKEECIREFCSKNTRDYHGGGVSGGAHPAQLAFAKIIEFKQTGNWRKSIPFMMEIEDDCVATIERTDLRNLKPLIALCPKSVPKWIQNNNYILDLADNGWTFYKK